MTKRIAVQDGLENVEEALRREGFQVTRMTGKPMANVDAVVVTGMSNNLMGIEDTDGSKFPVIEATGKSAREVIDQIHTHLGQT